MAFDGKRVPFSPLHADNHVAEPSPVALCVGGRSSPGYRAGLPRLSCIGSARLVRSKPASGTECGVQGGSDRLDRLPPGRHWTDVGEVVVAALEDSLSDRDTLGIQGLGVLVA